LGTTRMPRSGSAKISARLVSMCMGSDRMD
jgi:hypothetical protein